MSEEQLRLIEELLDLNRIPKFTKAGFEFSLYGRVSLIMERANKACTGQACLCGKNDEPIGENHSAFCPAFEPPASNADR